MDNNVSETTAGTTGFVQQVNQFFDALRGNFLPRDTAGVVNNGVTELGRSSSRFFKGFFTGVKPMDVNGEMQGFVPTGMMAPFAGGAVSVPNGWLFADGETIGKAGSGADHADDETEALFNMLKMVPAYGNSGGEVFANGDTVKLPNPQGRHIRCFDKWEGIDPGRAVGETREDQNKHHRHLETRETNASTGTTEGRYHDNTVGDWPLTTTAAYPGYTGTAYSGNKIFEGGSEVRVKDMTLPYIIKI